MRIPFLAFAVIMMPTVAIAECDGRLIDNPNLIESPICAPEDPARIVSLDASYTLGMSIELGLPLAGAPLLGMSDEELREKAEGLSITNLGHLIEPSVEKIIAIQPDLIIGSGFLGENAYKLASRIAPTALITAGDWKEYMKTLIEVSGSEKSAEDVLAGYQERVAEIRERVPDIEVSIVRITSWDFQVYLDKSAYAPFAVLQEAGVKRSAYETSTNGETLKRPDWEQLSQLDGDVLLYIVGGTNTSDTDGRLEEVLGNPLWQMLPAVKSGRVYRVDPATWMEFSGVGSAHKVLDDVERYIIGQP